METEYSKYEPIFGSYRISKLLGEGSYGKVYEIVRQDFGVTYKAALKVITVPKNKNDLKNAMSEGMDEATAATYFRSFVEEMTKEFALMDRLKGNSNIVNYEDHTVIEHVGEIGWDVLIRMELLTPLTDHIAGKILPVEEIVRLGIDLCKALEICGRYNIIHRDIKPENIFVSELGNFKLGDFGIARVAEKSTGASTKVGTYSYMAPEILRNEIYTEKVDQYSLGLVLYRLLNNNRLPFLPPAPEPITYSHREAADAQRIKGVPIPAPVRADQELSSIILRAIAFKPDDRFPNPRMMRNALERYLTSIAPALAMEVIHTSATDGNTATPPNVPYERTVLVSEPAPVQAPVQQSAPAPQPVQASQPVPTPQPVQTPQPAPAPQPVQTPQPAPQYSQAPVQQPVYTQQTNRPSGGRSKLWYLLAIPAALLLVLIIWGATAITKSQATDNVEIADEEESTTRSSKKNKEKEKDPQNEDPDVDNTNPEGTSDEDTLLFVNAADPTNTMEVTDSKLSDFEMGRTFGACSFMYVGDTATIAYTPEWDDFDAGEVLEGKELFYYNSDPDVISIECTDRGLQIHALKKGTPILIITDGTTSDSMLMSICDETDYSIAGVTQEQIDDDFSEMVKGGYAKSNSFVLGYKGKASVLIDVDGYLRDLGLDGAAEKYDQHKFFCSMYVDNGYYLDCDFMNSDDNKLFLTLEDNGGFAQWGNVTVIVRGSDDQRIYAKINIPYKVIEATEQWQDDQNNIITMFGDGTLTMSTAYDESVYDNTVTYSGTYMKTDSGYSLKLDLGPDYGEYDAGGTVDADGTMTFISRNGNEYFFKKVS
jgi:serine/threonine protein kinase